MKIKWSLSGMLKGLAIPLNGETKLKEFLVGKPIYLDRYKTIGHVIDVDVKNDVIYGEVPDKEYQDMILDSKGCNLCEFEIV